MQKMSKSSIDADRRLIAKSRNCIRIVAIEPDADGRNKQFDKVSYNDRQWHSLYVYCWARKEDWEFVYRSESAANPRPIAQSQLEKMGMEIEDDDDIIMKHKVYTEDELKVERIKRLRAICVAKGIPDDGDKRGMIDAILEAQGIDQE